MDLSKLSGEKLTEALALDIKTASDAALAAALVPRTEALATLLSIDPESATAEQADTAEALTASKGEVEAEIKARAEKKAATAAKFAAAQAKFAADEEAKKKEDEKPEFSGDEDSEVEASDESGDEGDDEADDAEADADDEGDDADDSDDADDTEGDDAGEGEAVTAATKRAKTRSTKAGIARGNKRPAVKAANPVTITAGANIDGFQLGQKLEGMNAVAKAAQATASAFPKFNERNGAAVNSQTGGAPQIHKHSVAKFAVEFPASLVADGGNADSEYGTVRNAVKEHQERLALSLSGDGLSDEALTAAAWCAPSPVVYSWIADYVVDGLLTMPEVSAPRGGLQTTTGPRVGGESQGDANLDAFGWIQTEAQAEAQQVKPFETIECPDFVDNRLDAIGYAFKIPILTQKAFPELVTDTLRFADVLWAHKVNRYLIEDLYALATARSFIGYGPSFTDTLEALSLIAVKERRKWNLGENAILEVKLPTWVKEVFRADMSRRNNAPLDDPINDQRISAHFASRRLAVEYISDFQELVGNDLVLPGEFEAIMYPAGAVVKAVEDVVNLSAIYDAASLSINEYVGVFFEQGIMTFKAGYGVSRVTVGINTAGEAGALTLVGKGDSSSGGSF